MDIACPECAAAYEIDEATIGPSGRKVRCAACGHVWRVSPAAAETAAPPEPEALPEANATTDPAPAEPASEEPAAETPPALPEPVEEQPPPKTRWLKDPKKGGGGPGAFRKILNWRTGAIAAAMILVAGGIHQRERVVRHLPQTARLFAAVGLPVNLRGIEIRSVQSRVVEDSDETVLVVEGELVNVANRRVDVPRLHFSLAGADGRQVYVWSAQADRGVLQPGETLVFRRRLAAPPAEAKAVSVRFLTRSDITAGIK